jgi:hypothetical protein
MRIGSARLDRAPARGLAAEVRDETARRVCLGLTAAGLLTQPVGAFPDGNRLRVLLPATDLEALALASGWVAAAEHGLEILPARLVGRDDRELGRHRRVGHADTVLMSRSCGSVQRCPSTRSAVLSARRRTALGQRLDAVLRQHAGNVPRRGKVAKEPGRLRPFAAPRSSPWRRSRQACEPAPRPG